MRLLKKLASMHLQKLINCSNRVRHLRQQLMLWSIAWSRPRLFSETSFICLLPVLMAVVRSWSGSWTDSVIGPAFEPDDLLDWSWPLCDCRLKHKERKLSIELSGVKFGLYSECLTKSKDQKGWLQTDLQQLSWFNVRVDHSILEAQWRGIIGNGRSVRERRDCPLRPLPPLERLRKAGLLTQTNLELARFWYKS